MFLKLAGTSLALCLALCLVRGKKDKDKWVIIETDGNPEKTLAKKSGSSNSGQDYSGGQDMGTQANLRCDSGRPFDKCQFRSPAGEITVIGTRCKGSMYGKTRERIEKICKADESLVDKTDKVCGITIRGVQDADKGMWSCEYRINGKWIKEEIYVNINNGKFEISRGEAEAPGSTGEMIQKEEMVLKPNNLIKILPIVGSEFKIEFDFYLSEYGRYEWYSILLFAVDKGMKDFVKYGDRNPGVWVRNDKTLHICSAINGNTCLGPSGSPTQLKKWTSVEICQHVIGGELTFEVLIDGKSIYKVINTQPCLFKNVKIFAADPLYMAQQGKIRNLFFSSTDETNQEACVVDFTPTPVPSSGYISKNPMVLKKDHLITVLPFIGSQYKITFDLYISSYGSEPWYNIIHFTHNGNAGTYGDRTPGIWISHEKKVHVASAINGVANYYIDSQTIFPLKTWIPVVVSQSLVDKKFIYEVKINGVIIINVENNQPQMFQAVKVYAGDPWYPAQDGKIKNVKVLTQDDRECLDQCLAV